MITTLIYKDFEGDFRVFAKDGQIFAQWDYQPSAEIEGWGTITEASFVYGSNYDENVAAAVALRYSFADELALQRQRDSKPDDFAEYNDFCEACKAVAREIAKEE